MLPIVVRVEVTLGRLVDEEDGQGLTEYALILALIALIAIAALTLLGGQVSNEMSTVANSL